jgi:hypothetical protein
LPLIVDIFRSLDFESLDKLDIKLEVGNMVGLDVVWEVLGGLVHQEGGEGLLQLLVFLGNDKLLDYSHEFPKCSELNDRVCMLIELIDESDKILDDAFTLSDDKHLQISVDFWMRDEPFVNPEKLRIVGLLLFHWLKIL